MYKEDNLNGPVAILAIVMIACAMITVFQRSERAHRDETETVPEYSTEEASESLSVEVSELISESRSVREEASSAVEAAEAVLSEPFNETAAHDEDADDYEYFEESAGDYIGYFTLTAYEWTGDPMADGQYPYYGAVACNSLPLGTRIYIEGYGTFTVCDRGGMGNDVIDIYLGDPYVCEQFGRRGADVYYAD